MVLLEKVRYFVPAGSDLSGSSQAAVCCALADQYRAATVRERTQAQVLFTASVYQDIQQGIRRSHVRALNSAAGCSSPLEAVAAIAGTHRCRPVRHRIRACLCREAFGRWGFARTARMLRTESAAGR